ncbi:MAG: phosphotransferase [Chloroflexales bacterium]|nr:phosphotransferase [Chloroflexales bacterium]
MMIDAATAQRFLAEQFDSSAMDVRPAGEGAWSRAFSFRRRTDALIVRFGSHGDDFEKDRYAYRYRAPGLPVPEVLAVGPAPGGFYAISRRVRGTPLEMVSTDQWHEALPSVVALLEALRLADMAGTSGFGGWDGSGLALRGRWSEHLLAVGDDSPSQRTHGWRARLAASTAGQAVFDRGFARLYQVLDDTAPRSLIHADLLNRNVLVEGGAVSGVFDWGCAAYGDHLYDLAWFAFWAPWHPNLSLLLLRAALERRWREVDYWPHNLEARLTACYLHIGLDHLAYNAYRGDWQALEATAARMRALVDHD